MNIKQRFSWLVASTILRPRGLRVGRHPSCSVFIRRKPRTKSRRDTNTSVICRRSRPNKFWENFYRPHTPKLDTYSVGVPNVPYSVFDSIDENGYTLDRSHAVVDSTQRDVMYNATPVLPGMIKVTNTYHWEGDSPVRVQFSDVTRITVSHRISTQTVQWWAGGGSPRTTEGNFVRLNDDEIRPGGWVLGRVGIPDADVLSALLVLCPNVK